MFYSSNFMFNGITNLEMGVSLVSMDSDVLNEHGINFTRDTSNIGTMSSPMFSNGEISSDTIELVLCYEENDIPVPWSLEKRVNVIDWMVNDDFKSFVSEDDVNLMYFFKCVGYRKSFDQDMRGVIIFDMKPYSPYAYIREVSNLTVSGSYSFNINNISNVEDCFKPVIKLTSEENQTIGINDMTIDVKVNEVIIIDNKLNTITNHLNQSLISKSNRKWIKLKKGKNTLDLRGNFDMEIDCMFPMRV